MTRFPTEIKPKVRIFNLKDNDNFLAWTSKLALDSRKLINI